MATQSIQTTFSVNKPIHTQESIFVHYQSYVDTQAGNAVMWWAISLLVHGCILVPLTFLLVYSLGGPATVFLAASMICFFVNFIGNMGGAPFKFNFNSLVISIVLHAAMVAYTLATFL